MSVHLQRDPLACPSQGWGGPAGSGLVGIRREECCVDRRARRPWSCPEAVPVAVPDRHHCAGRPHAQFWRRLTLGAWQGTVLRGNGGATSGAIHVRMAAGPTVIAAGWVFRVSRLRRTGPGAGTRSGSAKNTRCCERIGHGAEQAAAAHMPSARLCWIFRHKGDPTAKLATGSVARCLARIRSTPQPRRHASSACIDRHISPIKTSTPSPPVA